jgi:hypothetical protein
MWLVNEVYEREHRYKYCLIRYMYKYWHNEILGAYIDFEKVVEIES